MNVIVEPDRNRHVDLMRSLNVAPERSVRMGQSRQGSDPSSIRKPLEIRRAKCHAVTNPVTAASKNARPSISKKGMNTAAFRTKKLSDGLGYGEQEQPRR